MQKPFQVTEEMLNEINTKVAETVQADSDQYAPARSRTSHTSALRRPLGILHSEGTQSGSSDDLAAAVEDPINPAHYRKHPSGIECIDITRHMNFNIGNAVKYIWRHADKGDPIENLKKAQWYLDDEIRRLQGLR